jgi:hypothetical protein
MVRNNDVIAIIVIVIFVVVGIALAIIHTTISRSYQFAEGLKSEEGRSDEDDFRPPPEGRRWRDRGQLHDLVGGETHSEIDSGDS